MASAYLEGSDQVEEDPVKAVSILEPIARTGEPTAQNLLGWGYGDEDSVIFDLEQSVYWYKLSADQDDSDGQFHTGFYLLQVEGFKKMNKMVLLS